MNIFKKILNSRLLKSDQFLKISYFDPVKIARENVKRGLQHSTKYAHGKLVDLGCGSKPYKAMFEGKVEQYFGVDYLPTAEKNYAEMTKPDLWCDVTQTDLKAESFDVVLSTSVLEHISDPARLVKEAARLLKRGGVCIMTIPMAWPLHAEPFDYFRFTKYGIQKLFKDGGFDILELLPLEGAYAALIQLKIVSLYLHYDHPNTWIRFLRKVQRKLFVPFLNYMALKLDKIFYCDKLCLNFLLIARLKGVCNTIEK